MTDKVITFKGSRDGLYLIINNEYELEEIKEKIQDKIASAQSFFQGNQNIKIKGTSLSEKDLEELIHWMEKTHQLVVTLEKGEAEKEFFSKPNPISQAPIEEGKTKFVYTTLRSGNRVQFDGNIVIVGDVNPGAEVIATGNIIIMGALRGIAHAGAAGNQYAIVVAFSLQPTQLRIADIITRAPDQQSFKPTCPEKACISGEKIIILPYYKNI
ncbi:septum site-determining protein MinC [Irregularibacter muris]|uniref:Probable septum site-determining protein MinC n=1 Tax=Irregularibacter muris TaxID=1796619 RepID=A0AAE3HFY0_9FIRM|nr:septum site-determining protein MinC [Irregularibacter muris]MCR1899905.1 septum site-determining protein MinC [Irregularibacter muris]